MKWFKRVLKALLVLLGLVVVAALALFIYVQVAYNVDYPNTPLPKIAASKDPEVIKIFTNLGIDSVGNSQEEAIASIRKDLPVYSQIVDLAGVRKK